METGLSVSENILEENTFSGCVEEFKGRNETGTSFRGFSQALGRNGLTKSTTHGISYIRQVKLKTTTDNIDFIADSDSD